MCDLSMNGKMIGFQRCKRLSFTGQAWVGYGIFYAGLKSFSWTVGGQLHVYDVAP